MQQPTNGLLVGTRKGGFALKRSSDGTWRQVGDPIRLGVQVNDFQQDPRRPEVWLHTAGGDFHLGPTVFRSTDAGGTWAEASKPPAFDQVTEEGAEPRHDGTSRGLTVQRSFWFAPGHASESDTWYVATTPQGLFRSEDGGDTWSGVDGFNHHPQYRTWTGEPPGPPDGPFLHSVLVDPRDASHLFVSMSAGGTFESHDAGKSWAPINAGVRVDFGPEPYPEFGQDPHCVIQHPADPDLLYQQNHCGIYRVDLREGRQWSRIGDNMPKEIGDIGFGIVGHPTRPGTVWVLPMDGTRTWPRTAPGGRLAMYRTDDGGQSWTRQDSGLPACGSWIGAKRQALAVIGAPDAPEVCFGATCGEVWVGRDGGERFECVARHLPEIYSLAPAVLA
ncbi:BNR/Asp-box repeat protein [Planctomycetes bacterium Pla163]|uniref:BNR/Asp-box repeat protein n=1 Tax=Rohdeia mirabilis TaxID=2528008 RepID=A0A518D377_9BACT|nr:BNR/Asp-box repeat protein [Planctomycetes bacterium Pla163]